MRHKVVHDYLEVDLETIWDTLADDIETLITELERLLPSEILKLIDEDADT
jgi:uncharacterized protein with HEPN domain